MKQATKSDDEATYVTRSKGGKKNAMYAVQATYAASTGKHEQGK